MFIADLVKQSPEWARWLGQRLAPPVLARMDDVEVALCEALLPALADAGFSPYEFENMIFLARAAVGRWVSEDALRKGHLLGAALSQTAPLIKQLGWLETQAQGWWTRDVNKRSLGRGAQSYARTIAAAVKALQKFEMRTKKLEPALKLLFAGANATHPIGRPPGGPLRIVAKVWIERALPKAPGLPDQLGAAFAAIVLGRLINTDSFKAVLRQIRATPPTATRAARTKLRK